VPCHPHTSWIRLPQTYSLTPRWPSYEQWFLRYPRFCLVVRQVPTLCFTGSCTCNISKIDSTVFLCVLLIHCWPLCIEGDSHLYPLGALFNNACSAQIFWSLSSIEMFKILRKIFTLYAIFLTENFNFLKNCLYDLAQTFPSCSTILVNKLWESQPNRTASFHDN
jgi:hypothetical protein